MNAYERAWDEYHRYGEPGWEFGKVLGEHLRHGAVICTPDTFILARRVSSADPDEIHLSPLEWRSDGDCWMIWLAAGHLAPLIRLLLDHPAGWVSYQRRGGEKLRRVPTSRFLRYVIAQDQTAAATAAASDIHRSGTRGR